ncbi:uncharacterized protein isoform X2 [Rhodnius prolixus]|uniref:uncharacterized protein isoform X2 n=1 Tax=Rhodnius prolixus TaxID=13249 RepID=UPI003D18D71F
MDSVKSNPNQQNVNNLSLFFATCCIIDLFGIFPVIALPRTIIDCGWLGIPLALFLLFIQIYTAIMLGRCWIIAEQLQKDILKKKRYPYAALMELAFGRNASRLVTIILGLTVFGGGAPNLLVASQNLQLIGLKLSSYDMDFSYCYWLLILGLICCPLMWLGGPKDLKWVGLVSAFTVIISSLLTWYCLLDVNTNDQLPIIPSASWEPIIIAYGILAFQFDVHPMLLTIQMDMKNKNELGYAILIAFLVSGGLFVITSILCYTRYGTHLLYNTLQGLKPSGILYTDFVIVTIQIILSIVVGASPLFQILEEALHISPGFGWKRCLLRTAVMMITVLLAEAIPRFDLIMGLIGGALMGQLMFIYPPLMYRRLRTLYARKFAQMSSLNYKMSYGSNGVLPTNLRALVFSVHRADLSMEDRLESVHLLSRPTSVVQRTRKSTLFDFFQLERALDMGTLDMYQRVGYQNHLGKESWKAHNWTGRGTSAWEKNFVSAFS